MRTITLNNIEILNLIHQISNKNEFKVAPIQEIIKIITKERNATAVSVRMQVYRLHKRGYLENPIRGCYRLTEKGLRILNHLNRKTYIR
jgi:DNA-binding transcriptional regulator PaaX